MKQLNATYQTIIVKTIFPVLFLIILGLSLYTFTFSNYPSGIYFDELIKSSGAADWYFQALPAFWAIILVLGFSIFIFPLMDKVLDNEDSLQLKKGRQETEIALAEICKIHYNGFINPKIITLTLRQNCIFGKKIRFIPVTTFTFNPFRKPQDIQDLINRIEKANNTP